MSEAPRLPLPCPFCGELPEITKHFREEMWRLTHRCPAVGFIGLGWADSVHRLLKYWNHRS